MMGYGHITGSFTLDSSLINQGPFEEVKRKDIIGDQGGGGVVRVENRKRDSGVFGFSGWGNIGESLGGFLGGRELSSIKETRVSSNSKSIPILSTPQSILFVDLQLQPGESRSYKYRHSLPRGLPPTHRGRAIKVTYNLVVGTQRAARGGSELNVRHVDIPFRVLPGVNGRGDVLGHDLMSPHIILKSNATISSIAETQEWSHIASKLPSSQEGNDSPQDFLSYVETMLERRRQSSGLGLLSPTEGGYRSITPTAEEPATMKEAIDLAILQSTTITSSRKSANRFEITRSGYRVAVIMLARPAYRLGETVSVAVAFDDTDIPCYSLHATLESAETIDPAIALRSKASIQRVTRRVHAARTESTIFSCRVVFSPVIPISGTPTFITSGVSHEWRLRFEFVTSQTKNVEEPDTSAEDLLEEITPRDDKERERGRIMAGVEAMACETFEVTVPLEVYGSTAAFDEQQDAGEFAV
ncbi:maintenance of ploidy protein mob1 [Physcia stellaris]|nr:maintenance of ploidy protein mob1 [Physcia stellaris]